MHQSTVQRVLKLISEGRSEREIASKTGVSRGTIYNIRHGKQKINRRKQSKKTPNPRTSPYKCPGCSHMVVFDPCLICQRRADLAAKQR